MTSALPVPLTTRHRLTGVAIAAAGVCALAWSATIIAPSRADGVWPVVMHQLFTLAVAIVVVLAITATVHTRRPRLGELDAPVRRSVLLHDGAGAADRFRWRRAGTWLALAVGAVTIVGVTLFAQLADVPPTVWVIAALIAIPVAATSALSHTLIAGCAVVATMRGPWASAAPWVSAGLSGCLHWFVAPGGPVGAIAGAMLAWVLARSVQDTRGIGWAVLVHGCRDLIICTALVAALLN